MRPAHEIIETHTEEGVTDFDAVFAELSPLGPDTEVSVADYLALIEQHHAWTFKFLGDLVLDMLDVTDSLPRGKEEESKNLLRLLHLDKASRIHELVRSKQ